MSDDSRLTEQGGAERTGAERTVAEPIQGLEARTQALFGSYIDANYARTSKVFAVLTVAQWLLAILIAVLWSPYGWAGKVHTVHVHVYAAVFLGGAIASLPLYLTIKRPSATSTRHVVAIAQMLWSALLIHLSGGRIETHFHVFVSLAFLAFYRDWKILLPATGIVAADHLLRGVLWPESVYGVINPEWWRFLEHVFWVVFEDTVLILACLRGVAETRAVATKQAEAELLSQREVLRSAALAESNEELARSRDALARLAEVGKLAASVGHELRNPLGAIRSGLIYVGKRLRDPKLEAGARLDTGKVREVLDMLDREVVTCSRIVADLLDFARERPADKRPCPLRPLVDEVTELFQSTPRTRIENDVPPGLPIPDLDKDQFRQALISLVQNSVDAGAGKVSISARGRNGERFVVLVTDDGAGIARGDEAKIFEPLFTTKMKGAGLGLAIVRATVERHGGTVVAERRTDKGVTIRIELLAGSTNDVREVA